MTHVTRIAAAICLIVVAATASSAARSQPAPNPAVLEMALRAVACAASGGDIEPPRTLTLIDYSLPSTEPRLWVLDLTTGETLFSELVAHGKNTGDNMVR